MKPAIENLSTTVPTPTIQPVHSYPFSVNGVNFSLNLLPDKEKIQPVYSPIAFVVKSLKNGSEIHGPVMKSSFNKLCRECPINFKSQNPSRKSCEEKSTKCYIAQIALYDCEQCQKYQICTQFLGRKEEKFIPNYSIYWRIKCFKFLYSKKNLIPNTPDDLIIYEANQHLRECFAPIFTMMTTYEELMENYHHSLMAQCAVCPPEGIEPLTLEEITPPREQIEKEVMAEFEKLKTRFAQGSCHDINIDLNNTFVRKAIKRGLIDKLCLPELPRIPIKEILCISH